MTGTTIGMLIFPDVQLLDVAGPLELFRATPGLAPLLIAETPEPVEAFSLPGVTLTPDFTIRNAPELDVLFVPGGLGVSHAIASAASREFLAKRGETARYVTSVCTGALALGAAGLLKGYRAATHWRYMELLPIVGAIPTDERVVIDRNRMTSGGVTAGMDFGLTLAATLAGRDAAEFTQLWLQYSPSPPFDAGHPSTAPQAIVNQALESTVATFEKRKELLLSIR